MHYQEFQELQKLAADRACLLIENHNFRFHSSIRSICDLVKSGKLGDVVDVQISLSADISSPGNPFVDRNNPHYSLALRGGAIGDFLPHIGCLAHLFAGPMIEDEDSRWTKRAKNLPLGGDEFRALIKGERATAQVAFNGDVRPYGFWIRVTGTEMHVEANLYEPPRLTVRRFRKGELAVATLNDGIVELREVIDLVPLAGFWWKLAGTGAYDGLSDLIARTYEAIESANCIAHKPERNG